MSADLPRRRPDRRDYDASVVGYLLHALVIGGVLWLLGPWALGRPS